MQRTLSIWKKFAASSGALAMLASCAALAPVAGGGIIAHMWRPITANPSESWVGQTSGMYTYVLVGDIGGTPDPASTKARETLDRLLKETQKTQRLGTGTTVDPAIRPRVNQFLIPTTPVGAASNAAVSLDTYDFALSASYRTYFRFMVERDAALSASLARHGPFLVATRVPLNDLIADSGGAKTVILDSPVFTMDMSGTGPEAVPYFVESFKKAVSSNPPRTGTLTSYKGVVAQLLTDAGKAIPLMAEIWSKTLQSFSPAG